jgi:hypothetical protein
MIFFRIDEEKKENKEKRTTTSKMKMRVWEDENQVFEGKKSIFAISLLVEAT